MRKNFVSYLGFGVSWVISAVTLLFGIVVLLLHVFWPDNFDATSVALASLIPFGVCVLSTTVFLVLFIQRQKKHDAQKKAFLQEIDEYSAGERHYFSEEQGEYADEAKRLNDVSLLHEFTALSYGVYEAEEFDKIIEDTLSNDVHALSGVTYFLFDVEGEVREGPRKALLDLVQEHFGTSAYYGTFRQGLGVFCPVLSSREEFYGKARLITGLYSYTDEDMHIAVKAGLAFFPDFPPKYLTVAQLHKSFGRELLRRIENGSQIQHRGYAASDKDVFIQNLHRFDVALHEATSIEEGKAAFASFIGEALELVGATHAGIAYYDAARDCYELLDEAGSAKGFAGFSSDAYLPADNLDPFYEWSKSEQGAAFTGKRVYLNSTISSVLDALDFESIGVAAITLKGQKKGLVLLASPLVNRFDESKEAKALLKSLLQYGEFLVRMNESSREDDRDNIVLSTFDHYVYAIAKDTYNLSYVSPNLASAVKGIAVGQLCHKALYGREDPCPNCPLFHDNVALMVPSLSSGVFSYRVQSKGDETMMILSPRYSDFSSQRIDPVTVLLSDKSLHEDLQQEILLKNSSGAILAFRLRNIDTIKRMFRLTSADEPMKIVAGILSSSSLGRGLYRNGDAGFAYLLPFTDKNEVFPLAEKVQKALADKVPYEGKNMEFILDFAALSYPLEAQTPFALDALLRVLYQKADASGRGRIYEVDRETGVLVDYEFYARERLEEAMRSKRLPLRYQAYRELVGKNIAYLDAVPAVLDERGGVVPENMLAGIANKIKKTEDYYASLSRGVARFLGTHKKEIASSPLHGVILRIDESCQNDAFLKNLQKWFAEEGASLKRCFVQIKASRFDENFVVVAKKCGLQIGLEEFGEGFDLKYLPYFDYVAFDAKKIYGKDKGAFLSCFAEVRRLGLNVLVHDYRDEEERHYLSTLAFHYGNALKQGSISEEDALNEFAHS